MVVQESGSALFNILVGEETLALGSENAPVVM